MLGIAIGLMVPRDREELRRVLAAVLNRWDSPRVLVQMEVVSLQAGDFELLPVA